MSKFREYLTEGRVFGQAPSTYVILYIKEKKYVDYGEHADNNKAVQVSWADKIYYGELREYTRDMKTRMMKGFKKISLKDAQKIEKTNSNIDK